jgi:hypothetical protein
LGDAAAAEEDDRPPAEAEAEAEGEERLGERSEADDGVDEPDRAG